MPIPQDAYNAAVATHGRRVANRLVLADTPPDQRTLSDFYACYGSESDLPEHERGATPLIDTFDPTGYNESHYSQSMPPVIDVDNKGHACFYPEPGSEGAADISPDEPDDAEDSEGGATDITGQ